ncbi:hypothetical protein GCM10011369_32390 [Neiella marina]|uniref:25S rRNA (uridine-N(3))-methyltransferase BMT5-like domain-containing protein n=1 Tax=Neiella marina TaxID=508461 RepID=A0A8J2U9F6_9GAMM|nr:Rossmann-like fold-containing protein [Neiella marina]GGA87841.1 hypothetical protein GCM10011369_32390 [Neiella marina]
MIIQPDWRILTIGDGDLSFSRSLWLHHQPKFLCATTYDSVTDIKAKYGLQHWQYFKQQQQQGKPCRVINDVDLTAADRWGDIPQQSFDLVIFQFPLLPAIGSAEQYQQLQQTMSINTLNRRLLHLYLKHCFEFFLDPEGLQLACITSKDVKPYRDWGLEYALERRLPGQFIGACDFDLTRFPGYQMRNVDRSGQVKSTDARSFYWSSRAHSQLQALLDMPSYLKSNYCRMCRSGPFLTESDWQAHCATKRHRQLQAFEQQWDYYLSNHYK